MNAATVFIVAMLLIPVIALIAMRRRGRPRPWPSCGRCGYDVSASVGTTDRCPECGIRFVEGGIVPPATPRRPALLAVALVLGATTISLLAVGIGASMVQRARSASQAAAAQRQALQQMIRAQELRARALQQMDGASNTAIMVEADEELDAEASDEPEE